MPHHKEKDRKIETKFLSPIEALNFTERNKLLIHPQKRRCFGYGDGRYDRKGRMENPRAIILTLLSCFIAWKHQLYALDSKNHRAILCPLMNNQNRHMTRTFTDPITMADLSSVWGFCGLFGQGGFYLTSP